MREGIENTLVKALIINWSIINDATTVKVCVINVYDTKRRNFVTLAVSWEKKIKL